MVIVKIISDANGRNTPHDGRYVKHWNSNTKAGICEIDTTKDRSKALIFHSAGHALVAWKTQSIVEPYRPWDGQPNRPLTGLTIETVKLGN